MMTGEINNTDDMYGQLLAAGKIQSLGSMGNMAVGVYMCTIGALSAVGNGVVIGVLWRCKKIRCKPHNVLLLNMATADLLVTVLGYPFTTLSAFRGRFVFGGLVCALQGFLTFLLAMVTTTSLLFLSLYRYVAVCRPWLKYRITESVSKRTLIVVWGYSLFWTLQPLWGWSSYTLETFGLACSVDWTSQETVDMLYIHCLVVFCYLLPVGLMALCYWRIVHTALSLRHANTSQQVWDIEQAACHHLLTTEIRLSGMCLVMVMFFTAVWSPYAVVSLWSVYDQQVPVWVTALPTLCAKLASTLNPYIYVLASGQFRTQVRAVMVSCWKHNAVHPRTGLSGTRDAGIYVVDRTKDGVYIGRRTITIQSQDATMF